jgi:spoIIIJ-associated protein
MSESPSSETVETHEFVAGTDGEIEETVVVEGAVVVTDDLSAGSGPGELDGVGDAPVADSVTEEDADEADDDADDDDENPLETEAEVAADYLEELLDIADLDGDIDTFIEGDRAHVSIVSESQVLVGPDGTVLDALQELTRLAVMTETGNRSRLMLDVAGYRDTRRQQLLQVAGEAVERVRSAGERVSLEPMNPFERKIVHDAVAAAGLVSESEGEEPRRHVVVLPAS